MWAGVGAGVTLIAALVSGGANLAHFHITLGQALLTYAAMALVAGMILGLMRPWLRAWFGRTCASIIICAILVFGASRLRDPEGNLRSTALIALGIGAFVGPLYAWAFRPLD